METLYYFHAIPQIPVKTVNVVYINVQVDFATLLAAWDAC
jgi:hypothetical protein